MPENIIPTRPTLLTPNGGELWNSRHTISWLPSKDAIGQRLTTSENYGGYATSVNSVTQTYLSEKSQQLSVIDFLGIGRVTSPQNIEIKLTIRSSSGPTDIGTTVLVSKTISYLYGPNSDPRFVLDTPLNLTQGQRLSFTFEKTSPTMGFTFIEGNQYPHGQAIDNATRDLPLVLYFLESVPLRYQIQLSIDNGRSWKEIISNTASGATSQTYDFINEVETSTARLRIRAFDGIDYGPWDESDGVFTIEHNIAPTTPTNLAPRGITVDRLKTQRLSWQHVDSPYDVQSKADVEWRKQGTSLWQSFTSIGPDQEYFVLPNAFPNGQIEWRVRTYDSRGLVSPWSNTAVFTAAEPTNAPTIIEPTTLVSVARPLIEWTSASQASYQLVVEDSLGVVVWDTGEIVSAVKARTVGVDLINGGTYKVKVRIKDGSGLFSTFAEVVFVVSYTPPAKPIVRAYDGVGAIAIAIDHEPPTGSQPNATTSDVYRQVDGLWVRIATGIDKAFTDYSVASGVEYQYRIQTHGDNGTFTYSDVVSATALLKGAWIHSVQDAEASVRQFIYNGTGYEESIVPESAVMQFAGRTRPVIQYGNYEDYSLTVLLQEREGMGDMDALKRFVRGRETVCYRDSDGHLIYGHILSMNPTKEYRVSSASITIVETEFNEEV